MQEGSPPGSAAAFQCRSRGRKHSQCLFLSLRSSGGFRDGSICCVCAATCGFAPLLPADALHPWKEPSEMLTCNESGPAGVKLSCLVLAEDQAQANGWMWFTCFVKLSEGWFVLEAHQPSQPKFGGLPPAQTVLGEGLLTSSIDGTVQPLLFKIQLHSAAPEHFMSTPSASCSEESLFLSSLRPPAQHLNPRRQSLKGPRLYLIMGTIA